VIHFAIFLSGISGACFTASSLFFLKFWLASRDRFFLLFAMACWLISLEKIIALFVPGTYESLSSEATHSCSWIYLIRLGAFVLIFLAILDKNRSAKKIQTKKNPAEKLKINGH